MADNEEPISLEQSAAVLALEKIEALEVWAKEFQTAVIQQLKSYDQTFHEIQEWSRGIVHSSRENTKTLMAAIVVLQTQVEELEVRERARSKKGKKHGK